MSLYTGWTGHQCTSRIHENCKAQHHATSLATPADILAAIHTLGYIAVKGVTCQTCDGSGQVATHQGYGALGMPCPACKGRGLVPSPEAIEAGTKAYIEKWIEVAPHTNTKECFEVGLAAAFTSPGATNDD